MPHILFFLSATRFIEFNEPLERENHVTIRLETSTLRLKAGLTGRTIMGNEKSMELAEARAGGGDGDADLQASALLAGPGGPARRRSSIASHVYMLRTRGRSCSTDGPSRAATGMNSLPWASRGRSRT